MKRIRTSKGKIVSYTAIALSVGVLSFGQSALAQGNCQQVKATLTDVFSGGNSSSGTITQGGILNGTSLTVYAPGGVFTQDPNVVTFLGEKTITTNQGQLKTSEVYLYAIATNQSTALWRINPSGSTGRFAGATGLLFLNESKAVVNGTVVTYFADITGQICFANQ